MQKVTIDNISAEELATLIAEKLAPKSFGEEIPPKPYFTQREVEKLLSVGRVTLWKYRKSGKIKCQIVGTRGIRYPRQEVLNLINSK